MNEPLERAQRSFFREVAVFLAAIDANLDLLSYLVKDLLNGADADLLREEEQFADAVDEVLFRAGLAAMDAIRVLHEQSALMTLDQQTEVVSLTQRFDQLTQRWNSLVEAVNDVWKLRKPCH